LYRLFELVSSIPIVFHEPTTTPLKGKPINNKDNSTRMSEHQVLSQQNFPTHEDESKGSSRQTTKG
jgi:hypothetical protein